MIMTVVIVMVVVTPVVQKLAVTVNLTLPIMDLNAVILLQMRLVLTVLA